MGKIRSFVHQNKTLYSLSLITINLLLSLRFGICYMLLRLLPLRKNKIVISSYHGKGFGDNGKYLVNALLGQSAEYDLVWSVKQNLLNNTGLPAQVRPVEYGSLREIYELATAKIWIDNMRKPFFMCKRKTQFYIQTWHGSIGVKMIEKDAEDSLPGIYIKTAKADSRMTDLCIANGKHINNLYKNSFWYSGEVLMSGCPRNDIFFEQSAQIKTKVFEHFDLHADTQIVLYAPTFRQDRSHEAWDIDFDACISALTHRWGGDWTVLMRLHPNRASQPLGISCQSVVNASLYADMQELLAASDVLITDYSSSIFEFSLQQKPAFLFTPDITDYLNERGFYFDLSQLPFPQSTSNEQLIEQISDFDTYRYRSELLKFFAQQEVCDDGNASKRVVERINSEIAN